MKIDATTAVISAEKLRDYLLSPEHPIGRYKSAYFRSLGYTQEHWQLLETSIRGLLDATARELGATEFGRKLAVHGTITGPSGRSARVVTVWIILTGEAVARFVTAYPEE